MGVKKLSVAMADGVSVGDINAAGYICGKESGVGASLDAEDTITCTLADTWYPVEGTFTNDPFEDFSLGTTAIEYDGTKTQYFEIDWSATLSGNSVGITAHVGVKINGTIEDSSIMGTYLKQTGEDQAMSGTSVIQLNTGDEIQLVCMADGAGDILTFTHFEATITEFFD